MPDDLEDDQHYWILWGDTWKMAHWYDGLWWFSGTEVPKTFEEVQGYSRRGPVRRPMEDR
jgi:hypothetical protein